MIYILALLPATALVIGGYFVMFLANRSEGQQRMFGRYLSFWAFTLAGLVILGAIFAAATHPRMAAFRGPGNMPGPAFMMRGGPGFGRPGIARGFANRFRAPGPGFGRGPGGPGVPGPGPGPGGPPAPGANAPGAPRPAAPNAAPTPGGA